MPIMPGPGQLPVDPPQERVTALLRRRRLEGFDLDALGIDHADGVPDHAALAGGVHALQDQQDVRGALGGGPAVGEELFLQHVEFGAQRGGHRRRVVLAARTGEARGGVRVQRGQVHRARRESQQIGQRGLRGRYLGLLLVVFFSAFACFLPFFAIPAFCRTPSRPASAAQIRVTGWVGVRNVPAVVRRGRRLPMRPAVARGVDQDLPAPGRLERARLAADQLRGHPGRCDLRTRRPVGFHQHRQ